MVPCVAAGENPTVPDFTRGGKKDDSHDWNLGPTGARGWIYTSAGHSSLARQILVTAVAKGSPADGILNIGDVILGVSEKPFAEDARKSFANAIAAAEEKEGVLRLVRWRDGQSANVELKLPVLGAYSDTAPYDCPKSKKIFELGCQAIAKAGLEQAHIANNLNALALLASGKEEYRPMLAAYAPKAAAALRPGTWTWHYGYGNLFLAEYVLATGDQSILPELKRTTMTMVQAQSKVGTWGHEFYIRPSGNLNGYGCMNSPALVLLTAMVVAREAGVKDPDLDKAIAKGSEFLRWYVKKGAIPYGDHQPWPGHEDNGKCSNAAVLFDLLGDREAAGYYARMSTAAYDERERGHTGNFFNVLWALPGVSRCGPLATGAYMKEQRWYYDLARGWDGRFGYQGSPVGEEEHRKYTNWDCTGAYMLAYALPLKSLWLTGKKPCSAPALTAKEVDEVIAAGRDYFSSKKDGYQRRAVNELLSGLSSWSPTVRKRSAQGLSQREGDFVPTLLKMLAGTDRDTRYGACEALGLLGPRADAAAPQLRALLEDPDPWLQYLACKALPMLGPEARKASVSDLLKMTVNPRPDDPRRMAQRAACMALFAPYPGSGGYQSILADSLEGVDRELLYPAIRSVLENDDSAARGSLGRTYGKLTDRDAVALMPAILKAIQQLAPSNEMFGDGIRLAGLDLVSRLHVREGMPLCISVIELDRWGSGKRLPKCLEYLGRYGVHAKEILPQLQEMRQNFVKTDRKREQSDEVKLLDKAMAEIAASKAEPKVLGLDEFVKQTK
jgi:HEAT repeat protein